MDGKRKIGYISAYGQLILTNEEADRLFEDYNLLESHAIEWIERETRLYRENLHRRKEFDPDFDKYLKDELNAPVTETREAGRPYYHGGALSLMEYYRKRKDDPYFCAVYYHQNRKRLEVVREFMTAPQEPTESATAKEDNSEDKPTPKIMGCKPIPHANKQHRKKSIPLGRKNDSFIKMMGAFAGTDLAESKDNKWIWKGKASLFGFACGILFCGDRVIQTGREKYEIRYGNGDMPTSDICLYVENVGSFAQQRQNKKSKAITTIPKEWKDIEEIFEKVGIKFLIR